MSDETWEVKLRIRRQRVIDAEAEIQELEAKLQRAREGLRDLRQSRDWAARMLRHEQPDHVLLDPMKTHDQQEAAFAELKAEEDS